MDKERLVEIIKEGALTEAHLEALNGLVDEYPWFALPRFLRLKALEQTGQEPEALEVSRTVVFSCDRKHLYKWVKGSFGSMIETSGLSSTELEFLDSEEEGAGGEDEEDSFFLLDVDEEEEDAENDDADARPIPEKDESEMEEPELEDPEAVPVMDPLDDEEASEDEGQEAVPMVDPPEDDEETEPDDHLAVPVMDALDGDEETEDPEIVNDAASGQRADADTTSEEEAVGKKAQNGHQQPQQDNLIERFLKSEPGVIRADQQTNLEGDISEGSVKEDDSFITDTLAKIYVKQGLHAKAIYAYERLSLKYPEKSAYFAAQIEKIKNNANV